MQFGANNVGQFGILIVIRNVEAKFSVHPFVSYYDWLPKSRVVQKKRTS